MRLLRLLVTALAGFGLVRWLRSRLAPAVAPLAAAWPLIPLRIGPDGGGGPGLPPLEDTSWWPDFDRPRILDEVLPHRPACGVVYPLIYSDVFEIAGECRDLGSVGRAHEDRLLAWAREQAKRYCIRSEGEACQGVQEVSHHFVQHCSRLADATMVTMDVVYLFRCVDAGPGEEYDLETNPPPTGPPPPPPSRPMPEGPLHASCGGSYSFVAHLIAEVPAGCGSADAAAVEGRHAGRLLDEARGHATAFCRSAPHSLCRIAVETGHRVSHFCVRSPGTGATYVVSTIVYLFGCPATV